MFSRVKRIKGWGLELFLSSESSPLLIVSIDSLASSRSGYDFFILSSTYLIISSTSEFLCSMSCFSFMTKAFTSYVAFFLASRMGTTSNNF